MEQHLLEGLHLGPQLADDPRVRILVDDGVVEDPLGPVGVPERAEGLLVVVRGGRHGGHHHSFGVAAKIVLGKILNKSYKVIH